MPLRLTENAYKRRSPKTGTKYRAIRTAGYASKREAARARELKLLEKAGEILELREQVPFELIPKQEGERACKYIADFAYYELRPGTGNRLMAFVVEDSKGYRDPVYRIKKKLMLKVHGIRIRET